MANLSNKSIPLLISKLRTAIMTSQRARDGLDMWRRQEEIKDELVIRGAPALPALLSLFDHPDAATHAADVVGRIASEDAVIPLARLLAEPAPQHSKRAAAKALSAINTPDATIAVNLYTSRLHEVRGRVQNYVVNRGDGDEVLAARLRTIAESHHANAEQIADAYLLLTTDETLSQDAQARLNAVPLTPDECAHIESIAGEET